LEIKEFKSSVYTEYGEKLRIGTNRMV